MFSTNLVNHHRVRRTLYFILSLYAKLFYRNKIGRDCDPLWILGMFRSGTTLITSLYHEAGYNLGLPHQILRGDKGSGDLNPKGFNEDFIFADLARFILHQIDRSGDNPPVQGEISMSVFSDFSITDFLRYSLVILDDRRVTIYNKVRCYLSLIHNGLQNYLSSKGEKPLVKIPQLSFFYRQLIHQWPRSKFVVVFRHPEAVLKSSSKLTKFSSHLLYIKYHKFLLQAAEEVPGIIFLSYDHFLSDPAKTVKAVSDLENIEDPDFIKRGIELIDKELVRNVPEKEVNGEVGEVYNSLCKLAVNV